MSFLLIASLAVYFWFVLETYFRTSTNAVFKLEVARLSGKPLSPFHERFIKTLYGSPFRCFLTSVLWPVVTLVMGVLFLKMYLQKRRLRK